MGRMGRFMTSQNSDASQAVTVADVVGAMEQAYPPHLAEDWDKVGLICGDPSATVRHVAFALDCTDAVVDRAIADGAQMLIVHHPLLLRGVNSVAANTPKGRVIHKLLTNGIALFSAHTNADSARLVSMTSSRSFWVCIPAVHFGRSRSLWISGASLFL